MLADLILLIHFIWVLAIIVPIPLILIGARLGWRWVRNRSLRRVHLAMIAIVVAETILGIVCPLTEWEQALRKASGESSYQGSFIEYWISRILFYDFPPCTFTAAYITVGLLVLWIYIRVPPRREP